LPINSVTEKENRVDQTTSVHGVFNESLSIKTSGNKNAHDNLQTVDKPLTDSLKKVYPAAKHSDEPFTKKRDSYGVS